MACFVLFSVDKKYPVVAFNVYGTDKGFSGTVMPFKNILWNEGGGYSTDTGLFTAPATGIYQFNAHICLLEGRASNYYIRAGSQYIVTGEYMVTDIAFSGKCTSFSGVGLLRKSETAYVGDIYSSSVYESSDDVNSFSGVLIRAI